MNERDVALVQQSFEKIAAVGEPLAELFYEELFSVDPSLRAMFTSDFVEQRWKFMAALAMVVGSLHTPEKILSPARALAVKHVSYGVLPIHYTCFGDALVQTVKKSLGAEFTAELENAWVAAFRMLADVMKEAAYPAAPKGAI
jgi:nitric oxide dioxygenase